MTRTRLPALTASILLLLAVGLTGCGSDDDGGGSSKVDNSSAGDSDPSSFASDVDDALDAVGDDGVLAITADQLDGKFGFNGYEIDGDRLTMLAEGSSDQAEGQCLQAGIVLDGVGSSADLSIKYADTTINCEDFE